MKRKTFLQIIRLRSSWKIDKRIGNYKLPNGDFLRSYIRRLVVSQMSIDSLGIGTDGNLCFCSGGQWNEETKKFDDHNLFPDFQDNETCTRDEMERRIDAIVREITG